MTGAEAALDAEEALFLTLINNYRAQHGRAPLKISYKLTRPSIWKSKHMAQNNYFAHDDTPIGRAWSTRVRDCGYTYNTYIGENIAAGYWTAADVFEGWRTSPGHNSNMLSADYTAIGIGRFEGAGAFGVYWTTVLGGVDDGWMTISSDTTPVDPPALNGLGGSVTSGLDFSATCRVLRERRHPLASVFCSHRH